MDDNVTVIWEDSVNAIRVCRRKRLVSRSPVPSCDCYDLSPVMAPFLVTQQLIEGISLSLYQINGCVCRMSSHLSIHLAPAYYLGHIAEY